MYKIEVKVLDNWLHYDTFIYKGNTRTHLLRLREEGIPFRVREESDIAMANPIETLK